MRRVLVTGGAGFIGASLVRRLVDGGDRVRVVDDLSRGSLANLEAASGARIPHEFARADLMDFTAAREAVGGVDTVIHLAAAVGGIDYVFRSEPQVYRTNTVLNSNVLAAAREANVERYVYLGSACSYPEEKTREPYGPPLREEDAYPANPESSYGWSRLMGEYECLLHEKYARFPVCVLRLHNVYGPYANLVERSQVIPSLIRKALAHPGEPFVVWGTGDQTRDFVYVDDVVDAIVLGLAAGIGQGPIQIGTGTPSSIREVAAAIVRASGKPIETRFDTSRPDGDRGRAADCAKARRVLGWAPKVSLEEGLRRTYAWARDALK